MQAVRHDTNPCDGHAAACLCKLEAGHDGAHECVCGGSWKGDIDSDDFEVVSFPDTLLGRLFGGMFLGGFDDDDEDE